MVDKVFTLEVISSTVTDLLAEMENLILMQTSQANLDLQSALNHVLLTGGKRIRPTVALLSGLMFGANPTKLVYLAAAIELLHTATLVHDDVIDGSLIRRGMSTLNARWSPAATILTGDYIFARAAKLASDTGSLNLMGKFADTLAIIVNGEITQLFTGHGNLDLENYFQRIYAKTASLFELACSAAAILANTTEEQQFLARKFGMKLGLAFQIVDDILDYTGDQSLIGKPVGSDLKSGLVTLPGIYFFEQYPDHPAISMLSSGGKLDTDITEQLIIEIKSTDSIERAMSCAREHVNEAILLFDSLPASPEKLALINLASYIVNRKI